MRAPEARATKKGVPPTPRNARTGLFTPPGISRWADWKSDSDRVMASFPQRAALGTVNSMGRKSRAAGSQAKALAAAGRPASTETTTYTASG